MSELGDLLKSLRGKRSLREASSISGISHNYLSIVERGFDPRSGAPVNPTPETLKKLSEAYNYPYDELMKIAGYIEENKKENARALPESVYDQIIKETEEKYNVVLRDDPFIVETMKNLIDTYAKSKQNR